MLYEAIRKASDIFHKEEKRAWCYDSYMRDKNWDMWQDTEALNTSEIARLVTFLKQWYMQFYPSSSEAQLCLLNAIRATAPYMKLLKGETLLTIDFQRELMPGITASQAINKVFEIIAKAQGRQDMTASSKICHTIAPDLFVMFDGPIRSGYAILLMEDYGQRFLPRMQKLARKAVAEYVSRYKSAEFEALQFLCSGCGHTLPKVLDEYNYVKFTLRNDEIWDVEFQVLE